MSKQKEKKIKKLKKHRLWPYILGILLVFIVFVAFSTTISAFFVLNSVINKLQQGYDNSVKIAEIMNEEWEKDNTENMKAICDNVSSIIPNITNVCIVNSENEAVYKYGEEVPNFDYYISVLTYNGTKLLLSNDVNSFMYINKDSIEINVKALVSNILFEDDIPDEYFFESDTLTMVSFWYEVPLSIEDYRICVKNEIPLTRTEILFVKVVIVIIAILALALIIYYIISICSLISERRKLNKILTTDVVTGGFNLQYFIKKGNKLLKKNRGNKLNYAVISIQMEKYRNFCSCYGIKEGEELLEGFYLVLKDNIGKKEIVAHAEKADFALLLAYITEEELLQRIKAMVSGMDTVKAGQKKYFRIGIYRAIDAGTGIDSMYNCAGVARNTVTEDSEKRIIWFDEEMQKEQIWMRKVENDMERALANKEFQVYLQPKYSTKDEILSGAEALVRWIHPTEGFVPPNRFIPIFENNGFVIQLDDYMITEVARQQAKWISEGKKVVPISVNVSRVHFIREDLAEHICQLVDEFNVPHDVIELELTESAFFDDKGVLINTIEKLKAYGFSISMDDFGSGYSSLNSLRELTLDVVKLDAGFFRDEDESARGKIIVGDTISLAKKLDMKIVAEGIETKEQVDFLAEMGCDLIQGYYFAKPMPISEFEGKAFDDSLE